MNFARAMVFTEPGKALELRKYPIPAPAPDAMLVKIAMATICGSDIHTATGRRGGDIPGILGHEIAGRIIKTGKEIKTDALGKPLRINDRITWSIAASCGKCVFCKDWNLPQKCLNLFKYGHASSQEWPHFNGGFAEIVYIRPGTTVLKVPDTLSNEVVTPINCALATVMHGIEKMCLNGNDRVAVQGAGMLGIYAAAVLRSRGCREVFVIDVNPDRLAMAKKFGASTLSLSEYGTDEIVAIIKRKTDGFGVDAVLEVCGAPDSVQPGISMLRTGGRYVTAGLVFPGTDFKLDGERITKNMITISGIHNYRPTHLLKALKFVEETQTQYPYEELITARFPLDRINEGLTAAQERKNIRVAIC